MTAIDPRYPIGKFEPKESYSMEDVSKNIDRIASLPAKLENAVRGLNDAQLDTPYRDGGWTVRQVVHHVADSHMNAYIRYKWTLTEDNPVIKAYFEKEWAVTPETSAPIALSLPLIHSLHSKWIVLLKGLKKEDLRKEFTHPETKKQVPLDRLTATYAWHGEHHLAHITSLKEKMGW
ncbi:MAG: putative metal-dependent hydrolase [Cyclobacteriaceae bacterium]|nr:putative metal-dependent hydrolase [Cyclobacteriaceae bacterium]